MSGGAFNYDQNRIGEIANDIQAIIDNNNDKTPDRWGEPLGYGFEPEIIAEFQNAVRALRIAYVYAQRVDWLLSSDDGPEAFLSRLKEELQNIPQRPK